MKDQPLNLKRQNEVISTVCTLSSVTNWISGGHQATHPLSPSVLGLGLGAGALLGTFALALALLLLLLNLGLLPSTDALARPSTQEAAVAEAAATAKDLANEAEQQTQGGAAC
jgi:hypothetical protein